MKLTILADTPDYLVIDKPAGLTVHKTTADDTQETLADLVVSNYPEIKNVGDNPLRPGIVHRLDKMVSGVMVVAKSHTFFDFIKKQFQERTVIKKYIALVFGLIPADEAILDFAIHKEGNRVTSRPKSQEGKQAKTSFVVTNRFKNQKFTLVDIQIHTGRTPQIRSHFQAYGFPIVGETVYLPKAFKRKTTLHRLFLHSSTLEFLDRDGTMKRFESPLPLELETYLKQIT